MENTRHHSYALGHSKQELERLGRQALAFESFTRQVFQEAGISAGMRILEIGSGSGDVAFLAASLVGPTGEVVGTDRAAAAVQQASTRAKALGFGNVKFMEGDPAEMKFDRPFDAVIGRLVLMYYPDPIDTVRNLALHVCPGGVIVFQEFDMANSRSVPAIPVYERHIGLIRQTLTATGARTQLGPELYGVFLAAGLPGPSMRMDALISGGANSQAYDLVTEVVQSLLPVMEKLNIATATEINISTLAQRMREDVTAGKGVVLSPALIGAWSRKPA